MLTTLWQVAENVPAEPPAHWRFDDEWSNSNAGPAPWLYSQAEALTHAQLNPAYDAATFTPYIAQETVRRRVVNDAYTYTDYGWSIRAEYDVQYRTDGDLTPTATVPDLTRRGVQMRSRLPNGAWTAWGYITPPTDDWIPYLRGTHSLQQRREHVLMDQSRACCGHLGVPRDSPAGSPLRRLCCKPAEQPREPNMTRSFNALRRAGRLAQWKLSRRTRIMQRVSTPPGAMKRTALSSPVKAAGSLDAALDDDVRRSGGHSEPVASSLMEVQVLQRPRTGDIDRQGHPLWLAGQLEVIIVSSYSRGGDNEFHRL